MGFLIKKTFNIPYLPDQLADKIMTYSEEKFLVERISDYDYKFIAKLSIGVLLTRGYRFDSRIAIHAELTPEGETTNIVLTSEFRYELLLVIACWIILVFVNDSKNVAPAPIVLGFLPFTLFWYWLVFRWQENRLMKKVISNLFTI